tara:strand:+ start:15732 stop:16667 length:936 start_codon:yes stop_codon:yes gene_type:complete
MEKVLITGGAGYIGSVLTRHLLSKGYQVTVLDDLRYKQNSLVELANNPLFDFIYGDSRDKELLKKILPEFEVIIPLAALVGMPICNRNKLDAETINRDAVIMISELINENQKIIFPNTNSGYGTKSGETHCTEETPLEPISLYGITKVDAEKALLEKGNAVTLRLATVFGSSPRMRTDLLVNDFVQRAMFDKCLVLFESHFKRNYIHIQDVARVFEHCIRNYDSMKGNAYNVGLDDANLSKKELSLKIKEYLPETNIIEEEFAQDPDKRNYIVSNKKVYTTGFLPQYTLDYGIKELIKVYKMVGNQKLGNF